MDAGGGLGLKFEAACRYNLGQALMQQDKEAEAVRQFNETMIVYPNSIFARSAERILEQHRSRPREESPEQPDESS